MSMPAAQQLPGSTDRFAAGLGMAGLKLTAQRQTICQVLAEMEGHHHPTAQEVYEQARQHNAGVSLATVYNTLAVVCDLGLAQELGATGDGTVHYELDPQPHLNLYCVKCKHIDDYRDETVARLEVEVAGRSGFELLGSRLLYYGRCPACRHRQ